MSTVPKSPKPIVRVTPRQFLANRHVLMSPLIDCRVMVLWPPYGEWEPPKEPKKPIPKAPTRKKPLVLA